MNHFYILAEDGKTPIQVSDSGEWGRWLEGATKARRVAETEIGQARVSTVFLGINHAWDGGPPMLFETMVFGGELDGEQERCSTWEQAEAQHAAMVARVTK